MPRMESSDGKRKTSVREHERKTQSGKSTTVKQHIRRLNGRVEFDNIKDLKKSLSENRLKSEKKTPRIYGNKLDDSLSIKYDYENTASYSGQRNYTFYARDTETDYSVAMLEIVEFDDEISISMIEVEKEYRGRNIAQKLLENVMDEFEVDYVDIQWGYTTGSGAMLKKKLDKIYL